MKRRTWIAIVSALLLNSFALAQTESHFDLSGNVTFSGAKLVNAPSASTQIDSFGWQTSGVTHLNRWLGFTSQFGSGYATSNSLQLIGYTGPGTITHYSMLAGPRITIPIRGRVNPFVEGLVGGDRASTKLDSNGTSVTGRELQLAYGVGGGAQINLNRRFGVNVEAQYLNTEHTLAFTGWQPANFQVSAGIVIRMFSRTPQIAEQRRIPSPTTTTSEQPSVIASTTSTSLESSTPVASFQPPSAPAVEPAVELKPTVSAKTTRQPEPVAPSVAPPPVVTPIAAPVVTAKAVVPAPAPAVLVQAAPKPQVAAVPAPAAVVAPVSAAPAPTPRVIAQAPPQQQQPLSLGEYARRLREQKQRERQQQRQQ